VSFKQPPQPPEPFAFIRDQRFVSSLNPQDVIGPAARLFVCFVCFVVKNLCILCIQWTHDEHSYCYCSFSCFSPKICRMTSFAPREAMTTAAAAGAVCIIHDQRFVSSWNPQDVVGPAARHFVCFVCFVVKNLCIQWTHDEHSCPFIFIRGSN